MPRLCPVWLALTLIMVSATATCVCEVTREDLLKLSDRLLQLEQRAYNEDHRWDFDPGFGRRWVPRVPDIILPYPYSEPPPSPLPMLPLPAAPALSPQRSLVPWSQAMYCHPASRDPESACTDMWMRYFLRPNSPDYARIEYILMRLREIADDCAYYRDEMRSWKPDYETILYSRVGLAPNPAPSAVLTITGLNDTQ